MSDLYLSQQDYWAYHFIAGHVPASCLKVSLDFVLAAGKLGGMAPRRKARWHERLNMRRHELLPIREASEEEERQHDENGAEDAAEAADEVAAALEHTKVRAVRDAAPATTLSRAAKRMLAVPAAYMAAEYKHSVKSVHRAGLDRL